eukprot:403359365
MSMDQAYQNHNIQQDNGMNSRIPSSYSQIRQSNNALIQRNHKNHANHSFVQQHSLPPPIDEAMLAQELKGVVDQQNHAIITMINKIQDEKEYKMKQKNMQLMKRIKKLERKKRAMNGEIVSDEDNDDEIDELQAEMLQNYQPIPQEQQYIPQQPLPMNNNQNVYQSKPQSRQSLRGSKQVNHQPYNGDDSESIFALADSLQPGTYVPIVQYEGNDPYFEENPFQESEDKIRAIKERLRMKAGDYGYTDGLSIKERVKLKMQNYHNGTSGQNALPSQGLELFLGIDPDRNPNKQSHHTSIKDDKSNLKSRQSIQFENVTQEVGLFDNSGPGSRGQDNSFMGKFLQKLDKEKQLQSELYSNVKKDIPKRDYADLIRDFRIDEEEGMVRDPKMEPKENNNQHLSLLDKIAKIQQDKVQRLIIADQQMSNNYGQNRSPIKTNKAQQISLLQEILNYEQEDQQILSMIDRQYDCEDDAKRWLIMTLKPFFLTLLNEPKYDYAKLILEEAKRVYGYAGNDEDFSNQQNLQDQQQNRNEFGNGTLEDRQYANESDIVQLSRENLMRKFEAKLLILVSCFTKADMRQLPQSVIEYIRLIVDQPLKEELSLMEQNRLLLDPESSQYYVNDKIEQTMLIGMFILGQIMTLKIFLKPQESGLGFAPSKVMRRNLKIFATVIYNTFASFIVKSIKVKRTDSRSDSDNISKALFDKYLIERYLMDIYKQNDLEQSMIGFITKVIYKMQPQS